MDYDLPDFAPSRVVHLIPENPAQERELKSLRKLLALVERLAASYPGSHAFPSEAEAMFHAAEQARTISRTAKGRK